MRLVKAQEKNIETLKKLWFGLAKDMEKYSKLNKLKYNSAAKFSNRGFKEQLKSEDILNYLIFENETIVGFTTVKLGNHPSRETSKFMKIINLFILEKYRGTGYGEKTLEKIEDIAKKENCELIKVSFESRNTGAKRFYHSNGFTQKQITSVKRLD